MLAARPYLTRRIGFAAPRAIPGFFAQLEAPIRRPITTGGRTRAVYDEGARADDFYHSLQYAWLGWSQRIKEEASRWFDDSRQLPDDGSQGFYGFQKF